MNWSRNLLAALAMLGLGLAPIDPDRWCRPPRCQAAEPRRLTTDGRLKSDPVFSDPAGGELVFVVQDMPQRTRLMRLNLDDLTQTPIHASETRSEMEPTVSRDGRWLAYVQNRGNLSLTLVIEDRAGAEHAEVKPGAGFSGMHAPAIAPDGTRLLFAFAESGRQRVISVSMAGQDRAVLIDSPGVNNWPSWTPDGKSLVFSSTRDGNYEIYAARADGSETRRLTDCPFQDLRPRPAPDGKRLVFTSGRDGNHELYAMDLDGGSVARLTNHPERDDYATWHPDGRRIVYVAERDGKHDLWLLSLE